jgi:hypothetical protein
VPNQSNCKPFQVTPHPLGLPSRLGYGNIEELLELIEGPKQQQMRYMRRCPTGGADD